MELELMYDSMGAIPAGFEKLYTEKDGKAVLTGISGMKTQADIDRVQEGLRKEREDHAKTKADLKPFKGMNPEEVQATLDRVAELEAAAGGKLDDEAINKIVESRLKTQTAPLTRQIEELTTKNAELEENVGNLSGTLTKSERNAAVRKAAAEMKVHSTAIPDVELVAESYLEKDEHSSRWVVKDGVEGVTPGADINQFMKEMQKVRPHWWPESVGGGAGGMGPGGVSSTNPFKADSWNVTEQGALIRSDRPAAEAAAKAAGTTIGGPRPKK